MVNNAQLSFTAGVNAITAGIGGQIPQRKLPSVGTLSYHIEPRVGATSAIKNSTGYRKRGKSCKKSFKPCVKNPKISGDESQTKH